MEAEKKEEEGGAAWPSPASAPAVASPSGGCSRCHRAPQFGSTVLTVSAGPGMRGKKRASILGTGDTTRLTILSGLSGEVGAGTTGAGTAGATAAREAGNWFGLAATVDMGDVSTVFVWLCDECVGRMGLEEREVEEEGVNAPPSSFSVAVDGGGVGATTGSFGFGVGGPGDGTVAVTPGGDTCAFLI